MSRVIYTDTASTAAQETLRTTHQVRLVSGTEEGTGANSLPAGVYGFTYSPGLPNAPLFALRRYRSYETHRLQDGEVVLVGFVTPEAAEQVGSAGEANILVQPEPEGEATVLVEIPYSRIGRHRGYAAPNEHGFQVTLKAL
jgi:hypothetical protein